ncbi:MAG: hypothetical protein AAF226_05990, partial [Verrucomicrobiota bacterium]
MIRAFHHLFLAGALCLPLFSLGFENRLTEDEFALKMQEYADKTDHYLSLGEKGAPGYGHLVEKVVSGYQAEAIGLKQGAIVTEVGGIPSIPLIETQNLESPEIAHWFDPETGNLAEEVRPGIIGYRQGIHFSAAEEVAINSNSVNATALKYAVCGALASEFDPEFSEACWSKAMASGYQEDIYSQFYQWKLKHKLGTLDADFEASIVQYYSTTPITGGLSFEIANLIACTGLVELLEPLENKYDSYFPHSIEECRWVAALPKPDNKYRFKDALTSLSSDWDAELLIRNVDYNFSDSIKDINCGSSSFLTPGGNDHLRDGNYTNFGAKFLNHHKNLHLRMEASLGKVEDRNNYYGTFTFGLFSGTAPEN